MANTDSTNLVEKDAVLEDQRFVIRVPANLDDQTSSTSDCRQCFAGQQFSKRLQQFMIQYSLKVTSKRPLTDK